VHSVKTIRGPHDSNEGEAVKFPALAVRDLEGTEHVIPDDLPGGPHVIVLAFQQWHQSLVQAWKPDLERLADDHPGTEVWEVPSISSGYRLFRSGIDGGMRAGIPDPETRRHTLTVYTDLRALAKDLDIATLDTVQLFLVDCSGAILWRASGEPDAETVRSLDAAVAAAT
jgi:hypothetical protein